jgi:putative Holliday junction resolvase
MIDYPILAIDYGDKHFGLAYSDNKGIVSTPLEILHLTKRKTLEDIAEEIVHIAQDYRIKTLLIGQPQVFIESQKATLEKISKFETLLRSLTALPIIHTDESFSTMNAQNMLTSSGYTTKRSRKKIDKVAAALFLQEFLNSNKNKNV